MINIDPAGFQEKVIYEVNRKIGGYAIFYAIGILYFIKYNSLYVDEKNLVRHFYLL